MGIGNVAALKGVVAAHDTAPLDDVVQAVNIKLGLSVSDDNKAGSLRAKAENHRLDAARMLVALRTRVEAEGHNWWKWQDGKFTRSRKDIEKLMRLAKADDPEAAMAEHLAKVRHEMSRSRNNGANNDDVGSKEADTLPEPPTQASVPDPPPTIPDILVESAIRLVRQMTDHQRHEFMAKLKEEFS